MMGAKFVIGQAVRLADFVKDHFEGSCFDPQGIFFVIDIVGVPNKCTCGRPPDDPGHEHGCSLEGHMSYRARVGHSQMIRFKDQSGRECPLQVSGSFLEPA